jgi:hypothetical protein
MTATNIVASKYLHGQLGTLERETGVRQLVGRVAETIRDWGMNGGYFATAEDAAIFHDELAHMLLTQKAAFNSPVWFNVGCDRLEPDAEGQNWHWDPVTRAACSTRPPATTIRSARPASSIRVEDSMAHHGPGPDRRPCSSSGDRARGRTVSSLRSSKESALGRRHRPAAP